MKKLILLFIAIFIVEGSYALDSIGSYHTSFLVEYSNKSTQILQLKHIYSYAYTSTDNYTHDFTTYNAGFTEETNDDALIPDSISTKCSIRFFTYAEALHETYANSKAITTNIEFKPGKIHLGRSEVQGKCNNVYSPLYGQNIKYFDANYYIQIQPDRIKCKKINTNGDTIYIHYDEPIRIEATKGFPKETYKWRYSYKDAQGKHRKGVFTPFKTEDNGATIYVKGSDFLSESQFNQLVETQEGITISPDGADGYYKPLSFDSVNLTAKPTCPFIVKPIEVIQPKCDGYNAEQVKIKISRSLLNGENIKILLIHENDVTQIDTIISNIKDNEIIFDYNDRVIIGNWKVQVSGTYLDKDNQPISSYSATNNHQGEFTITAPDPISFEKISATTTSCMGRADGMVSCEVNGGTGEKICSLNNYDDKSTYNGRFQDGTFVFTGIPKGSYYLEATDENGCLSEKSDTIKISDPEPLKIEVSNITDLRCYGDSVGVVDCSFSGGTGRKTIILEDEVHKFLKDYKQSANIEDDTICIFNDLSAGTYYLSATDENGCVTNKDTEFEISEPDSLWLELTTTDATIFGDCNGTLSASFGGGTTGSYKLEVTDETITSIFSEINKPLSSDLCAGESEVTLIDGNNCTTTKKYIINQPDPLTAKVKQVDTIKCYGESTASLIVDSIKGGIPPYRVFWYNDNFSSEDYEIKDLSAEEYNLLVKDSAGASFELSTTIDQPKKIELFSTDIKPAFCRGDSTGSISLIAEGGTLPYKFFLEDTLSTSGEYADLPAGTYTARVEDKNNCITEGLFTIETLSTLTAKISAESPKCDYLNDGFIDLSVENGLEPYKITWYAEDKVLMEDIFTMTELPAGDYSVIVQDAAGCVEKVDTTLYKQAKLEIELPEKLYLCEEQSQDINIENERVTKVDWYLNNYLVHTGLNNTLTQEGVYKLDFLYDEQCHYIGEIKVDTINKSVKANFLVAEEIPVHDDAHLINITSKEDYDYVEWVYPENDAWVYGEDEHSFQLVFLNEGTYQVGMIAHKDKCEASLFKTIKTFTPEKGITIEENSYNITRFSIDKSPNNGTFTTHIELSAKADVILYLYNASTGHIIAKNNASGENLYDIPFSVKTLAGEYILLLIVPEWEKSSWIKMVIR